MSIFDKYINDIKKLISNVTKNSEFEFDLNKNKDDTINYEKYIILISYLNAISKKNKFDLNISTHLDINYTNIINTTRTAYRISILDKTLINTIINSYKKRDGSVIFEVLLKNIRDNKYGDKIEIYKKIRVNDSDNSSMLDINDLYVRIRLASEEPLSKSELTGLIKKISNLNEERLKIGDKPIKRNNTDTDTSINSSMNTTTNTNIIFRLKDRLSLIISDVKNYKIAIDLTNATTSDKIITFSNNNKMFESRKSTYELEVEGFIKNNITSKDISDILQIITRQVERLIKVIQKSNFILTNTEKLSVYDDYNKLFGYTKTPNNIDSANVISLEIKDLPKIPDNYAVSDKADGEHGFLFITNNNVYIIDQNMHVKATGIILNKKQEKYNNSILDGELIFLPKYGRHIFMVFDCLFSSNEDMRKEPLFAKRMSYVYEIINSCFTNNKHKFNGITQSTETNLQTRTKFYENSIIEYLSALNNDITIEREYVLIRPKYFLWCIGGLSGSEIYKYSSILWNNYKFGKKESNYPYSLDGLVYQPINQTYEKDQNKATFQNLKWKPEDNNSIDFYIEFARNPVTKEIYTVFDNVENKIEEEPDGETILQDSDDINTDDAGNKIQQNKLYKICYLHVGKRFDNVEKPVLFEPSYKNPNKDIHITNIMLDSNNIARDIEGSIIQDKTVVEFYYDTDAPEKFKWKPMRTRLDKTESVNKYQRKYGNAELTANNIWKSIRNPIKFTDIEILSKENKYISHLQELTSRVTYEEMKDTTTTPYYGKVLKEINNITAEQREFHNLIKTQLINCYMSERFSKNNTKQTIFDIACGEGGDILKFYNAHVKSVTGIDVDYDGLHNPIKGSIERYNRGKKGKPDFPPMEFINADFNIPLTVNDQMRSIRDNSQVNKDLITKYFEKNVKFDCLNIQFAFHYFLKNEECWKNACDNINKTMKIGGVMVITTFDAEKIDEFINKNNNNCVQKIMINGEEHILHDIIKKYEDQKIYKLGNTIDVHVGRFMEPGRYESEYLVDKRFIIPELREKCNLELVETDTFENIYHYYENYIKDISLVEPKKEMRDHLIKETRYYNTENPIIKECLKITFLNRYYVFRKTNN